MTLLAPGEQVIDVVAVHRRGMRKLKKKRSNRRGLAAGLANISPVGFAVVPGVSARGVLTGMDIPSSAHLAITNQRLLVVPRGSGRGGGALALSSLLDVSVRSAEAGMVRAAIGVRMSQDIEVEVGRRKGDDLKRFAANLKPVIQNARAAQSLRGRA